MATTSGSIFGTIDEAPTRRPRRSLAERLRGSAVARIARTVGTMVETAQRTACRPTSALLDRRYLIPGLKRAELTSHLDFMANVARAVDRPGARVLELGSREVTGPNQLRKLFTYADYIGFDYYPGPNVDVAGDAHRLSELVPGTFDLVFSSAVFEHLALPWLVAEEIAKILNVGGRLAIETHFAFSAHERPWNFFQFSDMGLRALFSPALGFETIEATMQNPIVGRFSRYADPYLRFRPVSQLYCHSNYYGRKVRDVTDFDWHDVAIDQVVDHTHYPAPRTAA